MIDLLAQQRFFVLQQTHCGAHRRGENLSRMLSCSTRLMRGVPAFSAPVYTFGERLPSA